LNKNTKKEKKIGKEEWQGKKMKNVCRFSVSASTQDITTQRGKVKEA
jgi:hypothetical protein